VSESRIHDRSGAASTPTLSLNRPKDGVGSGPLPTGKRMVLATEFRFGTTGDGIAHGLRAQGWDIFEIDPRHYFVQSGPLFNKIASRLTRRSSVHVYNEAILQAIKQAEAQAFLTLKGADLHPRTLRRLSEQGVISLNYYPDYHFHHNDLDASTFGHYDIFITTKSFQLEYLQKVLGPERISLVHHGYCDLAHVPRTPTVDETDYVSDLTYVGNYSPYKEEWLRPIVHQFPELQFRIVGSRWDLARDRELRRRVLGYVLSGDFYARIVQHSRVNIALHAGPSTSEGWQDLVSTRTFEIPACKGFMLHIDNAEVRSMFEPGREIDVFANVDEMIDKIAYYLARPVLRREMIDRAYARCVPAYGYDARAELISRKILSLLETRRRPRQG
jgi:glycosyltransferase involved in cell wall biosynthesis